MSTRTILILLLTAIWFLFCHYRYTCIHKQACWGCAPSNAEMLSPKKSYGPITFISDGDSIMTNDNYQTAKDSILAGDKGDNLFEIVGYYYPGESAPPGFENMGLARAAETRDLLASNIPKERIRLTSKQLTGNAPDDPFAAVDFNWKTIDVTKSEVVETANGSTMYFPSNSAQKERDPTIDDYLKQVAERVKASGEKVNLIGHTDDQGRIESNQKLGLDRANGIKRILLGYGVSSKQITTKSLGESKPFTTNDTEQGRHQNRRVELSIVK